MANKKTNLTNIKGKAKNQFKNIKQNIKGKSKSDITTVKMDTNGKKPKRKKHVLLIALMFILVVVATLGLSFCIFIIVRAPEFNVSLLYKSSSSIIYAKDNTVIAELGAQKRENVTYDKLPDVLVDAIVAVEDSKFFRHSGIDLLRFSKAVAGQLLGHSDAGGGSTLTMQIVKNTYNGTESKGIKGIIRKFTDIYMSVFKVEKTYTKQEIIEFYVNQAFLGSGAYGVAQASQTFFGKTVGELNLAEAATIAGLFQAPTAYDPYVNPDKAQARRDQVLSLMVRHGYITQDEADVAKAIDVADMLVGYNYSYSQYQGIIDTVAADVLEKTGYDPYVTSMKVYTTFDLKKQDVIDKIYDGTYYKWKNDVVQFGVAVTDVDTGAVVAIGTGRNRTGEKQFNYATSIKRHPGSTAKPIFDYGPAIEFEGWGTGTMVIDDVYTYSNGTSFFNVDKGYRGIMTAKTALANSRNIPALQAFQVTSQEDKYKFVTNLGITPELVNNEILESSSIGAFNGVSPLELSAAYGAFSRGGYYIEPYTFTKVEYNDSNETYTYTPSRVKAMNEETAYMVNMILKYAVTSGAIGVGSVSGTDVASKTGTSSADPGKVKELHLSSNAIGDSWQIAYSPDYSIAFWYGYDTYRKDYYLTSSEGWGARKAIVRQLVPRIMEKNSRWTQPSGVTTVTLERESNYLASEYTPDDLKITEYYKKGTEPTEVSYRFKQLEDVSNLTYTTVGNQVTLSWSPINTPEAIDETFLQEYFKNNYGRWADKYYQRRLSYNASNIGNLVYEVFVKNSSGGLSSLGTTASNSFTTSITNASSQTFVVKSTYTIFRANASPGREISVHVTPSFTPSVPNTEPDNSNQNNNNNDNGNDNGNDNNPNNN